MLEAVSVENDPLPPSDPLDHRYDQRRNGRVREGGPAEPGSAPSERPRDRAPPDAPAPASAADPAWHDDAAPLEAVGGFEPEAAAPAARLPATIEEFLAGLGTRAFRFAELGLRHREDALDAVQDAMMKMLGYRERPASEWTPLFWSILRSRIVDIQRRRTFRLRWLMPAPRDDDDAPMDWADDGPDPQRTHDGREAYGKLADALGKLPRRQREAFSLRILEELDVATTARAMGCSEGAVKTHLSRAREALQRQLEEWR
ncbi:RNA polymerase sigma factor [Lysobacter sp. ISL-42]|nr:RNA polymerase sigma factor [Lysobacter sp. ISL-42]MBT2751446.1 RNA polymerase sigma factor [Lysobacter sp. ISL-50]MBT2778245.1 RNA polymerase sigma factor [Lysobacter sp. ISL-54]MBT2782708.1 RNA polymerase sigma factor [Lysobacter sp. ISL-52]